MDKYASQWEIEVYTDEKGKIPFNEWLSNLDFPIKARILERLNRIRDENFGDSKLLQDGVFELRFHFGSGYRVYYGKSGQRIVLLLTGGDKSNQKRDIKKALEYWKEYKDA